MQLNPFKQLRKLLKPYFVCNEIPIGDINGNNTNFELLNSPSPSNTLQLYLNGLRLTEGNDYDYTINNNKIKLNYSIPIGSVLVADYFMF